MKPAFGTDIHNKMAASKSDCNYIEYTIDEKQVAKTKSDNGVTSKSEVQRLSSSTPMNSQIDLTQFQNNDAQVILKDLSNIDFQAEIDRSVKKSSISEQKTETLKGSILLSNPIPETIEETSKSTLKNGPALPASLNVNKEEEQSIDASLMNLEEKSDEPKQSITYGSLREELEYKVIISHVKSPLLIWVQVRDLQSKLSDLNKELK